MTVNLDETRLEVVEGDDPIGPEFEICLTLTNVGDGLERNTSFTLYLGGSIASGVVLYDNILCLGEQSEPHIDNDS